MRGEGLKSSRMCLMIPNLNVVTQLELRSNFWASAEKRSAQFTITLLLYEHVVASAALISQHRHCGKGAAQGGRDAPQHSK